MMYKHMYKSVAYHGSKAKFIR